MNALTYYASVSTKKKVFFMEIENAAIHVKTYGMSLHWREERVTDQERKRGREKSRTYCQGIELSINIK